MRALRVLGLPLMLPYAPLLAQAVLSGTVREDSTGRPLAGVEVLIARSGFHVHAGVGVPEDDRAFAFG